MEPQVDVVIVGAGAAGLNAAWYLQQAGKKVLVLEAAAVEGGRLATDHEGGFLFDRGFQVLQTAYPELNRKDGPVRLESLNLKRFFPGALVFHHDRKYLFADPLRQPSALGLTLLNPLANFRDKWNTLKLRNSVLKGSVADCFSLEELNTLEYLQHLGFSKQYIDAFFRPFLKGIFLDDPEQVSASMFRFVFRAFSAGDAAIPAEGMFALPRAMRQALKPGTVITGVQVVHVDRHEVRSADGTQWTAKQVLLSAAHERLTGQNIPELNKSWRSALNFYFEAKINPIKRPILCLNANPNALIGNFCFLSDVSASYAPKDSHLLSCTHVGAQDWSEALQKQVQQEMAGLLSVPAESLMPLKHYAITDALPAQQRVSDKPRLMKTEHDVWLAGDSLANSSLNAALLSGRLVAEAILGS
jgi:phytoene dehydrogenase-like protein